MFTPLPPGRAAAAMLVPLALLACANDDPDLVQEFLEPVPGGMVSLAANVQPVFDASCALTGCHAVPSPQQGMSLESAFLFDPVMGAVGVPSVEDPLLDRIEPGSAEMSYLVRKIEGTQGAASARMPFSCVDDPGNCDQPQYCLCDATIQVIRDWIDQGALDN